MNRFRPSLRAQVLQVFMTCGWVLGLIPVPVLSQTELAIEAGGSTVSPPEGVEGDMGRFLVAGLRGSHFSTGGSGVTASFLVGRTLESGTGGDFLSGTVDGTLLKPFGWGWSGGLEARAFGFRVQDPFPYRSLGAEGGPILRFSNRFLSATLRGVAGGGRSKTVLVRTGRLPDEEVTDDLWRYGGTGELLLGSPRLLGGVAVGVHESSGGTYRSAGLRLLATRGGAGLELRLDRWQTPSGDRTTGGLALVLPVGGWSLRGFLGRTEPDPLTLAEPGGGSTGMLVGRTLYGSDPLPPPRPPLHRVLERSDDGVRLEIRVRGPAGTTSMELAGDFTRWAPLPMARDGEDWVLTLEAPIGVHHFGFFADGDWFLPEDAPDAVSDDWGRKNATIVIEP